MTAGPNRAGLALDAVSKRFGETAALDNADLPLNLEV
jgi:hypothetical protein